MIFAGIVAGGCGSRVKSAVIPKQFIEIGGVPIIVRTVRAFLAVDSIDVVYVGIKPDWHEYTDKLFERFGIDKKRVRVINGGADRNGTVMNIANAIYAEYGENEKDIILTHDAVRPFVTEKIIRDNISAMAKHSACGTYMPAADTIIRSDGEKVRETLNRSELYQAQTPQTFRLGELRRNYYSLSEEQNKKLTDTCSVFTACNEDIYLVVGDALNFKITTDSDLRMANALAELSEK
ncbi:IspD/TarI family cytidylyltransferase [Ruminococcus sp.]